jgi:hypothetical protein
VRATAEESAFLIERVAQLSHSDGVYLAVLILAAYWAVASVSGGLNRRRGRAKGSVYIWAASFVAAALVTAYFFWRLL